MLRKSSLIITLIAACVLTYGCASQNQSIKALQALSLDMNKEEVLKAIGEPTMARGATKNKYNQTIEVWQYNLSTMNGFQSAAAGFFAGGAAATGAGNASPVPIRTIAYWLYFSDGKLAKWGQAGDWTKEASEIYELRLGPTTALSAGDE